MYGELLYKIMKKTTIYLLKDQDEKLRALALRRGGKIAEWIRRAIDNLLEKEK